GNWLKKRRANFFVLSDKEAKLTLGRKYRRLYNGKIRKTESTDLWIEYNDVKSGGKKMEKLFYEPRINAQRPNGRVLKKYAYKV
ncbi:MAG: hypothetical protein WD889_02850, partial [Candidatus Colwellbacteria bacterium]